MEHRTSVELKGFAEVICPQELSKSELLTVRARVGKTGAAP